MGADNPQGDYRLVQAFLVREGPAIEELADRLGCIPRLLRAVDRRLGGHLDGHDLEDLSQVVAVTVLRKLDAFRPIVGLEAWVYRIAYLQYLNAARRRWQRGQREQELPTEEGSQGEIEGRPHREPGDHMDVERVDSCVDELDARLGEVIRLKHYDDLTFTQIGRVLSLSPNTVKARYYKGIEILQRKLGSSLSSGGAT